VLLHVFFLYQDQFALELVFMPSLIISGGGIMFCSRPSGVRCLPFNTYISDAISLHLVEEFQ